MRSPPHLYDVVIKEQPEAVTLDDGDVMTSVGTAGRRRKRFHSRQDVGSAHKCHIV